MKRLSGLLIPITSLPSPYGIGDMGPTAYRFIDFCHASQQALWQILPINPTDGINGHSPYSSHSAFAGNPLMISPDLLIEKGWLLKSEMKAPRLSSLDRIDYPTVITLKEKMLRKAYARFSQNKPIAYQSFLQASPWLKDYALFLVIKSLYGGASWDTWPLPLRKRKKEALAKIFKQHADEVDFICFGQFVFYQQWVSLKAYTNARGVKIIGDIPIYVNFDSADVWCSPKYFQVDSKGRLVFVSGCPPDYFSKTGQRWGNPTYHWPNLKQDRYRWWLKRLGHHLLLYDFLRIDHFRGFAGFWQIPAHEKLAVFGKWVKAPGKHFFDTVKKELGVLPIIAEDLGEITPDVVQLMRQCHFPGMRVMLFGFGSDPKKNPHHPQNYHREIVAYTGTHDNNTVRGWLNQEAKDYEIAAVTKLLKMKINRDRASWDLVKVLWLSQAGWAIAPMQDILNLSFEARLNTPATKINNWSWLMREGALTSGLSKQLKALTIKAGRYEIK